MNEPYLMPTANNFEVLLFAGFILLFLAVLFVFFIASYRLQNAKRCVSPYTKKPMWLGDLVPLSSVEKVMRFLYYDIHGYDNRVFPMKRAMICRDTGRIFPYTASWWGYSEVDWNFLQKRCPGVWVSWGSLTAEQQQAVRERHHSMKGFQTEKSCPHPSPRAITDDYIYTIPGPLYVDLNTNILMGWKRVPDTKFEVLIVQKPIQQKEVTSSIQPAKRPETNKEQAHE